MVIFDADIIPDKAQRDVVVAMFKETELHKALEDSMTNKDRNGKVLASTQVVLLSDVHAGKYRLAKNSILISDSRKLFGVKLLNIKGTKNKEGLYPVPYLIAFARGLISMGGEHNERIYAALNRLHIKLTQGDVMSMEDFTQLRNGTWQSIDIIISLLPVPDSETADVGRLHRAALATLIAA
jgi:hypothetical protein